MGKDPAPRYMLLPGDPGRVPLIGGDWDSYEEISFNREFRYARGRVGGVGLGACSTGIGAPSAEIALMELAAAGAEVGEGAVRLVGSPDAYCEPSYPAIADRDVTFALIEACEQLGLAYTVGLTASVDSFFAGQDNATPVPLQLPTKAAFAEKMRSYCGSICAVGSNRATGERRDVPEAVANVARAANRAVEILCGWDALLAAENRRYLSPSLLMSR